MVHRWLLHKLVPFRQEAEVPYHPIYRLHRHLNPGIAWRRWLLKYCPASLLLSPNQPTYRHPLRKNRVILLCHCLYLLHNRNLTITFRSSLRQRSIRVLFPRETFQLLHRGLCLPLPLSLLHQELEASWHLQNPLDLLQEARNSHRRMTGVILIHLLRLSCHIISSYHCPCHFSWFPLEHLLWPGLFLLQQQYSSFARHPALGHCHGQFLPQANISGWGVLQASSTQGCFLCRKSFGNLVEIACFNIFLLSVEQNSHWVQPLLQSQNSMASHACLKRWFTGGAVRDISLQINHLDLLWSSAFAAIPPPLSIAS